MGCLMRGGFPYVSGLMPLSLLHSLVGACRNAASPANVEDTALREQCSRVQQKILEARAKLRAVQERFPSCHPQLNV